MRYEYEVPVGPPLLAHLEVNRVLGEEDETQGKRKESTVLPFF